MSELALLKNRIQRERAARQAAEQLLEDKSLELYMSNKDLEAYGNEAAKQKEQLQKKSKSYSRQSLN